MNYPESKDKVAERLRLFANGIGGPSALARALGISPQQVSTYLGGRRAIGTKMQARLEAIGCDTTWLMRGQTREEIDKDYQEFLKRKLATIHFTEEHAELIAILDTLGVKKRQDLWMIVDPKMAALHLRNGGQKAEAALPVLKALIRELNRTRGK